MEFFIISPVSQKTPSKYIFIYLYWFVYIYISFDWFPLSNFKLNICFCIDDWWRHNHNFNILTIYFCFHFEIHFGQKQYNKCKIWKTRRHWLQVVLLCWQWKSSFIHLEFGWLPAASKIWNIPNNQQHLIMCFHCLCNTNVAPHCLFGSAGIFAVPFTVTFSIHFCL